MTGTGDYEAYPMGSRTSPAVVLRLYVSAVKAGKRAVIGCEHRRIILYRSHVVDALLYLKMAGRDCPRNRRATQACRRLRSVELHGELLA